MKRVLSLFLALVMVLQYVPATVFAAAEDNLCAHHAEHTADCGYAEEQPGSECTHTHSIECYAVNECAHVHGEECAEACGHDCMKDVSCWQYDRICGHEGLSQCGQECFQPICAHAKGQHDGSCGYAPATEAQPCLYECAECAAMTEPSSEPAEPSAPTEPSEPAETEAATEATEPVKKVVRTKQNQWNGRSAVFVGDSITAGSGTSKTYYQYLNETLGFGSATVMGVAGSCISAASDYGQTNQPLIDRYKNIPSADLIFVFMGTNDYGHETPLGSVSDTEDGTFYGALNVIIPALVAEHASSKIVFVTPLHRYGFGTSKILGTQFMSDSVPNGVGATLGDYVKALKTVCDNNSVSVIDLHTEFTLDPADADVRTEYMPDGLHPNEAGHELIAGIMEPHILNYSPAEKAPETDAELEEEAELIYGNKFASGYSQQNRASSRVNQYLKAGTVITLKDPAVFQWACTKTSDENSSNNLGYFPDSAWSDKASAVVENDGWIGFVFKYRDENQTFDLSKPLSDYITIHVHSHESVVTVPTCKEKGYTTYTCECGDSYVDDYVDATGHTYENGICTACGAEHPNLTNYEGKVISILGDSISTFAGYIPVADGFNLQHRPRYPQSNLFSDVNLTWWMQTITALDAKLGINDSWAGSTVTNTITGNSGDLGEKAAMASLTRIQNLGANGTPDVILFYGGTNDIGRLLPLGSFDPATAPTEVDLTTTKWTTVADAYVDAIMRLQYHYPEAEILAMLPTYTTSYYTNAKLAQYNTVFSAICEHYGIPYIDLRDCGITTANLPDGIHPDASGMDYITEAVLDTLLNDMEMEAGEHIIHSVTHNLNGAESSLGYYKSITHGKSFVTTITGENVTVSVTMGGVDITDTAYANSVVTIAAVTGDLVITAQGRVKPIYEDHLQQLPENLCCSTNLWSSLVSENTYYTGSAWGNVSGNSVYSITIPVAAGDQIWATSFQKSGTNGGSRNGIRLTWFDENGVLESISPDNVYAEFVANASVTAPDGAVAVNVVMWNGKESNEVYILNREHTYENGSCTGCGEKKPTEITLGNFAVAGVGKTALSKSDVLLSQKTLIAVPYCGATLHISVSDGYRVKVHSGNNYNNINQVSDWLSDGETYTLPLASIYMRVSIQRADGGKITLDELETADVVVSYESDSDICEDNADVAQILTNTELPVLIHLSDIHGDTIRAERAASFADFVGADALLASGDLTAYEPDDWGNALFDSIDNYPNVNFIYGIGNHDTKIAASAYYESIYNSYFKGNPDTSGGKTYYYRDLANQKLRIVAVNQQEGASTTTSGGTCYSQAQVDWLVEALKTTPAGYGVVLMYHSPETTIAAAEDPDYSEFFQVGNRYDNPTNSYSGYSGTFLMDLVDAFMLRENFTWNYSEKDGTSPVTLNADFTNVAEGVEFIAHVTGHVHSDSITYLPGTACKQLLLGVTCTNSMYGEPGGYYGLADYSDLNRVGNTSAQDAFNAYIIDRENKTVRVLRVGARQTVSGDIRDDMTIPYSVPFENGEYLFDTEGLIKLDLSNVEWVNYGIQEYGTEPTYLPGQRWSTDMIFDVPYDGVTFYIKINAPYELGIRSGKTDTTMSTNYYWLNNKELISGDQNRGYVYAIPAGHEKFILSFANVTRDGSNNVTNTKHPISFLELQAAGVEIWYRPEPAEEPNYPFNTADKVKLDLSSVEWVNYGYQPYGPEPTYHVGTRLTTNMIFDVPYEGVTFYIKINAPYELGIRSGETGTAMDTNLGWLNNKYLPSGNSNYGFAYAIPAGHHKFILTIGNVTRNSSNNVSNDRNPITLEELEAAGLEIWYVPCTHTYKNGVCTGCGATQPGPVITQQPVDGEAKLGEKYMVEVKAEGEGLKYQWYFRNAGSKNFAKSSVRDNTYDDVMTTARAGREVYCVITDANGNSVTTETAKLICVPGEELAITKQPENGEAVMGERFCVTVEAKGDNLKYQWYFRNKGATSWTTSGVRDNTYDDVMTTARADREIYCVITDAYGNKVTSDTVKLIRIPMKLEITQQPADSEASLGDQFCVTVLARGEGLKYQWYYRNEGGLIWYKSGVRDNTYDDTMTKARMGREVYCVITDAWGNKVTTETAKLIGVPNVELKILTQPEDDSAPMGENFCITVEAQGDGLKYQWYFRNKGGSVWYKSGVKDNTYDDVMTKARAGRDVYCVITDAYGNQLTTQTAKIILK